MNEAPDTYTTRFNQSATNPWTQSQAVGIWGVNSDMERMTPYGPIKELRSMWQEWLPGDRLAFLVEPQQANPSEHIGLQGIVRGVAKVTGSLVSPARETGLPDPYFAARANATRVTDDEKLPLFLFMPCDIASATLWMNSTGPSLQENEGIPAYSLSETWDEENDQRFDFLVEKEALGELDSSESGELERLSKKRYRTLARVSDEDWARERERSKALTELQDLLERYAPLFAKRR
jgi:hypothetical protein